jgi:hypothetical protein
MMHIPPHVADAINGGFEGFGGLMIWDNVRAIIRDKMVRGVSWRITFFWFSWGIWNLYYYPSLGQWISWYGGLAICLGNCVWLWYAIKYRKN